MVLSRYEWFQGVVTSSDAIPSERNETPSQHLSVAYFAVRLPAFCFLGAWRLAVVSHRSPLPPSAVLCMAALCCGVQYTVW